MKINFHTNCQGYGLEWFFKQSPDAATFTTAVIQNFRICTKEETREQEKEVVESADILFYHATKRVLPWPESVSPRPGCTLIPISVFYQGANFFMENANKEMWHPAIEMAKSDGIERAIDWLIEEADLNYAARWEADSLHMANKEADEGVDPAIRISGWQQQGRLEQLFLTKNHPTSLAFIRWANVLLSHIGKKQLSPEWVSKGAANNNLVNLPCEDWVTTAARRHLGMAWGATDYENRRAREFAKDKLTEWLA